MSLKGRGDEREEASARWENNLECDRLEGFHVIFPEFRWKGGIKIDCIETSC
jgi:hypothetical protein